MNFQTLFRRKSREYREMCASRYICNQFLILINFVPFYIFFHQKHLETSTISAGRVPTSSLPLLRATNWARDSTELEVGAIAIHTKMFVLLMSSSSPLGVASRQPRANAVRVGGKVSADLGNFAHCQIVIYKPILTRVW